jgi:hypothetical protein
MLQSIVQVDVNRQGVLHRRGFLRGVATGTAGAAALSWLDFVSLKADDLRQQGRACIVLWMQGGPSQFETFDPKPGTPTGGETKAIATTVPGVRIAENFPETAKLMDQISLIRAMTNKEGNHQRATYQLHTGYLPTGTVKHPSLGAIAAAELGSANFDLPHYVSIAGPAQGAGFLGVEYEPFVVQDPNQPPANVTLPRNVQPKRFTRRIELLKKLERDFAESGGQFAVEEHQALYDKAASVVLSPRIQTFDLSQEPDTLRDAYGRTPFGQGCLLARRLVQIGVTFVEVRAGNWDTHQQNFDRSRDLSKQVDPGFATLLRDLKDHGLLDSTLVVWMGEFGRTPRINPNAGRDHWPKSFSVALAGGGVKGGQVIGATNADGTDVKDRPVGVPDLLQTVCHSLKIDSKKENTSPLGRPMKIVDGGERVKELFG